MPSQDPDYPSSFPRVNWTLPGVRGHPPFTAAELGKEVRWAARAASRAWADGTVSALSSHDQQTALRLCILDKVLEWNFMDLLARVKTSPRPPRSFAEWSYATEEHIKKAYILALPAASAAGIPAPPLEAMKAFLREAMRKCLTRHDADDSGDLTGVGTFTAADLTPFTSWMTGFTVYRLVPLPGEYVHSKMVVKHYPGLPPIGPLPLPPTSEGAEVTVFPPPTTTVQPSLTPKAATKTLHSSPTPKAVHTALHSSPTSKATTMTARRSQTVSAKVKVSPAKSRPELRSPVCSRRVMGDISNRDC